MKRIVCILVILALLASFAACSSPSDVSDQTTSGNKETSARPSDDTTIYYEPDDLPASLDFDGRKIVILTDDGKDAVNEICVDELSSDVVNDSI